LNTPQRPNSPSTACRRCCAPREFTGLSGKQIAGFADEIEASTLATAEQVQDAAGVLATFRSVAGETFTRTMTLAQDMSAVFGTGLRGICHPAWQSSGKSCRRV
jgi:hypothetical protein